MRPLARAGRALLAVAALLAAGRTVAQPIVVDGTPVESVADLAPGVAYAPAAELADALGADVHLEGERVALTMGARIVLLPSFPAGDAPASASWTVDGAARAGAPALAREGRLHLPVKDVAAAFGGSVAWLAEQGRVVVVMPRAAVRSLRSGSRAGAERVSVSVDGPVPFEVFHNEVLGVVQVRFARADAPLAEQVFGEAFTRATLLPSADGAEMRVSLAAGAAYEAYALPGAGGAYDLVVEVRPGDAGAREAEAPRIVIDPGHGGADDGLPFLDGASEDALALELARELARELSARGFDAVLTRDDDRGVPAEERRAFAASADLFVSLHAADLPPGRFHLYHLGETPDAAALELAIRQNAQDALASGEADALRRRVLLGLVPDLDLGRRYADGVRSALFAAGGYEAQRSGAAPLAVLEAAGGRGLLLEFGPADLGAGDRLAPVLADALGSVLAPRP